MTYLLRALTAVCLFSALAAIPARADGIQAFSFSSAAYRVDDPFAGELGFDFSTGSSDVLVTALGYINDGFDGTHTVAIFDFATRTILANAMATVTTVGGGATSTTFTYIDLADPVTLAANTQYVLVSQFFAGEHYFSNAIGLTSQNGLTMGNGVYSYAGTPATPFFPLGSTSATSPGDFGPNMKVMTPVPELSSIYLVASGLFTFGMARLRRS